MDTQRRGRREQDYPVLVLSQDYELFFQVGGSIDKCLLEPSELLCAYAKTLGAKLTFFVDAGMLCCLERLAPGKPGLAKDLSRIQRHIASLATQGHEIGLHIHPHWEDTRWSDDGWDFRATRYRLSDFSAPEIDDIVSRYATILNESCDGKVQAYRAGGFCIEPFGQLREGLLREGITIDSSVVPGAHLRDAAKGFDFRRAPDIGWWRFDQSALAPDPDGAFLEIPVTPNLLPFFHYWGRAVDRVLRRQPESVMGDGLSKAIGRQEILRRLTGRGRVSELSIDATKARYLHAAQGGGSQRLVWNVMGHPKLLGRASLDHLSAFIDRLAIERFETVSGMAALVDGGEFQPPAGNRPKTGRPEAN